MGLLLISSIGFLYLLEGKLVESIDVWQTKPAYITLQGAYNRPTGVCAAAKAALTMFTGAKPCGVDR
jgi:hypothetical protein